MLGFTQVESSNIDLLKHDSDTMELIVVFKSGAMYKYSDVSSREYEALLHADSIGSHFNRHIKTGKSFEKFEG